MTLALEGRHQLDNAAVPSRSWNDGRKWSPTPTEAIVTGLTRCEWPARLEWLRMPGGGELLIDAAHNPAGAMALASYLQDRGSSKLPIVFAAMADKDLGGMIKALEPVASMFVATSVPHARARGADEMAAAISKLTGSVPVIAAPTPELAVARAFEQSPRAVAAGSIYMVGPLRSRLIAAGAVPPGAVRGG